MSATAPRQTFYVVLPRQVEGYTASVRMLSRLLKEEEDQVRKRMEVPTFQLLRRFAQRANAEGLVSQFNALGINTFMISDTEVSGHLFLWAEAANQGAGGMAFRDFGGQPLYCPYEDLVQICIGKVQREDGTQTTLIDLHRKSTPITPRIDSATFDFATTLQRPNANMETLFDEFSVVAEVPFDRSFDGVGENMNSVVSGLGRLPSEYRPPAEKLPVKYLEFHLKEYNVYSFLSRAARLDAGRSDSSGAKARHSSEEQRRV